MKFALAGINDFIVHAPCGHRGYRTLSIVINNVEAAQIQGVNKFHNVAVSLAGSYGQGS